MSEYYDNEGDYEIPWSPTYGAREAVVALFDDVSLTDRFGWEAVRPHVGKANLPSVMAWRVSLG